MDYNSEKNKVLWMCRYDLVQADLAVASFNDLSVINLRRLFAHKGPRFMDLQKQAIEDSRPRRKLTISSDSQSG